MEKNIEDLSKGMSQKVQFISTVLHNPDLIILDEPFSGFDPINANLVKNNLLRLRDEGKTIIFSTHRMESVDEICDHLAMINNSKKILDGNTEQIKMDFKSNNYIISHNNELKKNKNIFDLVTSSKITDNIFESEVALKKGKKSKDLIVEISGKNNIISFNQRIPNTNDIFIMKVNKEKMDKIFIIFEREYLSRVKKIIYSFHFTYTSNIPLFYCYCCFFTRK